MSLLLAGTASSAGKTTAAIGLIAALKASGIDVQPAKAGPDFLDAGWLSQAADRPCLNLDVWMAANASDISKLLGNYARPGDFLVVEGAMGLYDGDEQGQTSSAYLACLLNLPIVLILNAKGLGQSAAAIADGFLHYQPETLPAPPKFCGIICSNVAGERHARILREALAPICRKYGVIFLGCLPQKNAPQIPSRHLGLVQAQEKNLDYAACGAWFAEYVNLEHLLGLRRDFTLPEPEILPQLPGNAPVIAIARDQAFAFLYADLPLLLHKLGAKTVFFSPLADAEPPDCDGVYLPGGYPELFAQQLASNMAMSNSLRKLASRGIPIYGECGGYLYLGQSLTDLVGERWPMLGLLPFTATMGKRLAALGYRKGYNASWLGERPVLGHEFHYARECKANAMPLWQLHNARGENVGASGASSGNVLGSFLHLYPLGSRIFWEKWLQLVIRAKEARKE